MNENEFKIMRSSNKITFLKNGKEFSVKESVDDDLWFDTPFNEVKFEFDYSYGGNVERKCYLAFLDLIKLIIGRYILEGDNNKYYMLPRDFINLDDKEIIWHCDGGTDNILKLKYDSDNYLISVSIIKNSNNNNSVRIRTNGSDYGSYYKEFASFYKWLCALEKQVNESVMTEKVDSEKGVNEQKRLSLFKTKK